MNIVLLQWRLLLLFVCVMATPPLRVFAVESQEKKESFLFKANFDQPGAKVQGWKTRADVTLDPKEPFKGAAALLLRVDPMKLDFSRAEGEPFAVKNLEQLEVSGATRSNLYFPDLSFNGKLSLWLYDGDGKLIESQPVISIHGDTPWKAFRKRLRLPTGSITARLVAEVEKSNGTFWLDELTVQAVQAEGPALLTRFWTKHLGNMFYPGDETVIHLDVETQKPLGEKKKKVLCRLTDYWGMPQAPAREVILKEAPGAKKGGPYTYKASVDFSQAGLETGKYYEVRTEQDAGGLEPVRGTMSFAILPVAETFKFDPFETPFGTHTWDARQDEYFFLSGRLGIRRCLVFWDWPRQPPYTPQWEGWNYEARLGNARKAGMLPYGILYPIVHVEHDEHERSEEDLREGVRQSIQLFKKEGLWGFQAGNEPPSWNLKKVQRNVEAYKTVYEETKKTDPSFFVIGSAIGPSEEYFKLDFGKYCDAYNVHSYGSLSELRSSMRKYRDLFKKYGNRKPIYSTEIGSKSQGLSRHEIAMDLVRKVVCFLADGGEFFTWFAVTYSDAKGTRAGTYGDSMDLFSGYLNMYNPRLDAVAYYHILNAICEKKFVREINYENGTDGFLFRNKKGDCLQVYWNLKEQADTFIPLKGVKNVRLVHLDGSSRALDAQGRGVTLRIGDEPQILLYSASDAALAEKLATPPDISLTQIPSSLIQGQAARFSVRVAPGLGGNVEFLPPPGWKAAKISESVEAGGARLVVFEMQVPPDTIASDAGCSVLLAEAGGSHSAELYFRRGIESTVDVSLLPVPAASDKGQGGIELTLRNRGDQSQAVQWSAEITREIPMEDGVFTFSTVSPVQARFSDVSEGKAILKAGEEKKIALTMAGVERLAIYQVKATVRDPTGRPDNYQRYVSGFVGVPRLKKSLGLDGDLSEADWARTPVLLLNEPRQFLQAKPKSLWTGAADLNASLRFLWDEKYLYVGVEVHDDIYANKNQDALLWAMDGLQFLVVPTRGQKERKGRYDLCVGVGQKGPQAWSLLSGDISEPEGEIKDIRIGFKRFDDKTGRVNYEVAIPWARLAPFKAAVGRNLGLSMIVNEDDGEGRGGFIGWFSGVHLKEMDHVGDLILTE